MTTASATDLYAITCNVAAADSVARAGAKAWVSPMINAGSGHDRLVVIVRSRGGRHVEKWMDIRLLRDFRVATLPPDHPRYDDVRIVRYEDRARAETLASELAAAQEREASA